MTKWSVNGQELARRIESNELSVDEFANVLSISADRAQQLINEKDLPTMEEIEAIEDIFQWPLKDYIRVIQIAQVSA